MATANPSNLKTKGNKKHEHRVAEKANELLKESKKMADEYYEDGVQKAHEVQESLKEYSDELVEKVKRKPLTSILIAGGIGFLLSSLLRK